MSESRSTHPRQAVRRSGWSLAVALALAMTAGSAARAQTAPIADASFSAQEIQVFRHPAGVEIHVLGLRPGVGADEMIDALESAARLLRDSRNVTPTAHEEPAPTVLPEPTEDAEIPRITPTATAEAQPLPPPIPVDSPAVAPLPTTTPPTVAALRVCSGSRSAEPRRTGIPANIARCPVPLGSRDLLPEQTLTCEAAAQDTSNWFDQFRLAGLPATLLWQPPLANALQPRLALNLTSLKNDTTLKTIDTAIGGELGLFRITPAGASGWEFQPDFFAVVVSRFSNNSDFTAADYRFGFPLTFAYENWHAKIAYEHTSTHLGDDFIKDTGDLKKANIRDELVLGLDRVFAERLRVYGVFGYAGYINTPTVSRPERFDGGVEWSRQQTTDWRGQPFAALDVECRGDQHFVADTTLQLGWQWKEIDTGRSFRTGVELYNGRSPYGQFYLNREKWVGFGVWIDF